MIKPLQLATSLLLSLMCGCQTPQPPVPLQGFESFDSPRDFDPPGRVIRLTPEGAWYGVGTLEVTPHQGHERTREIVSEAKWSLDTLLRTVGVAADKVNALGAAQLMTTTRATLSSTDSIREYIDDADGIERKAVDLIASAGYKPSNKYYVIRETVSTRSLNCVVERSWLTAMKLEALLPQAAQGSMSTGGTGNERVAMVASFDAPMRVWYKLERLEPVASVGIGPNEVPALQLRPVTSEIHLSWTHPLSSGN